MPISDEKKAELDAVAAERAGTLGGVHVAEGKQFYHAEQVKGEAHVPGCGVPPTIAELYAKSKESAAVAPDPTPVSTGESLPPTTPDLIAAESEAAHG
jgi:hypothetical protein